MRITAIPNFNYSVNNRYSAQKINFKADSCKKGSFFTQVDDYLYRGGTPNAVRDLQELKDAGISVIVNVADEILYDTEDAEKMGMQFHYLPMGMNPKDEMLKEFFEITDEVRSNNKKMYVHCIYGKDRSGLAANLYKLRYNLPVDTSDLNTSFAKMIYDEYLENTKNF